MRAIFDVFFRGLTVTIMIHIDVHARWRWLKRGP